MPNRKRINADTDTPNSSGKAEAVVVGVDFSETSRGLYVGTAQSVTVIMAAGNTVTFPNVPVGILPIRANRVTVAPSGNLVAMF